MDILLIDPPPVSPYGNLRTFDSFGSMKADIRWPPRDLLGIAGYLRKFDIPCKVIDANTNRWSLEKMTTIIAKEMPKLIVVITSTTTINEDMRLVRATKWISPQIVTAMFGAHITALPKEVLKNNSDLDVAITGDVEPAVKMIVDSGYKARGMCHIEQPLDNYGIPAHDLVDKRLYSDPLAKRLPMTITSSSKGCVNKCVYCVSQLHPKHRLRSVSHFIEELKYIRDLGFKEVFFIDCGFTNDMNWAQEVATNMMKEKIDLTWWCLSRTDHLDWWLLKRMHAAGCHSIGIGVESANPQILKNISKNITLDQVLGAVKMIKRLRMKVLLYFQFGLPGETRDTMRETLKFAKRSGADYCTFGIATPVPGTPFYDYIKKNNYFITKDWGKFDPSKPPVYSYPDLSSKEMFDFSLKAYRSFYLTRGWRNFDIRKWRSYLQFLRRYL